MLFRLLDLDAQDPVASPGKLSVKASRNYKLDYQVYMDTGVELFVHDNEIVSVVLAPELRNNISFVDYADDVVLLPPGTHKLRFLLSNELFTATLNVSEGSVVLECFVYTTSQVPPSESARFPNDFGLANALNNALASAVEKEQA